MSHHINIERITTTPIPLGHRNTLRIVVGQTLKTLTLNRREFADYITDDKIVLLDAREGSTLIILTGLNASVVGERSVRIGSGSLGIQSSPNLTTYLVESRLGSTTSTIRTKRH